MPQLGTWERLATPGTRQEVDETPHSPVDISPVLQLVLQLYQMVIDVPAWVFNVTVCQMTIVVYCHSEMDKHIVCSALASFANLCSRYHQQNIVIYCWLDGLNVIKSCTFISWLHETHCNQWKIEFLNKPKLRTYVKFKTCFKIEDYVMPFMSRRQRSYLAQLRCGILWRHIETGRWYGVKEENRLCKTCNNNQIENEYHFIFHCIIHTQH